jgi:hypothetical protein
MEIKERIGHADDRTFESAVLKQKVIYQLLDRGDLHNGFAL